uniref:SGNH hydrolase-type esterase domain-containing protein n=1 Tax=Kalanchoe fedtschenkoi TaxID=63787 RepID=A0A7N0TT38_KALFE
MVHGGVLPSGLLCVSIFSSEGSRRGMVGPVRPQFVLFGSSIVQTSFSNGGWGAILTDIYSRKADILVRGYYGWNSRRALQVLDKVFPKEAEVQPSLVIVYFGGNDSLPPHPSGLGTHVPLEEYVDNMKKIAAHLKSLSESTRIIFLTCPPVNEAKAKIRQATRIANTVVRTNEMSQKYSEACVGLNGHLGVQVVDVYDAIRKQDGWMDTCFTDGVHLAEEGSKVIVKEILKVLKEADWEPCLHWKSMPTEFSEDSPHDLIAPGGKGTINPSEWTSYRATQWD